jgi:NAD(P)-dependent dehydrogenase (short-subunit alcohol dehydrogenase family)
VTVTFDFSRQVFLVAGGSRGIGADAARAFARAGASVVIGARDVVRLEQLVDEITAAGGRAVAVRTDVTSPEDSKALVETAMKEFGRLDFAFNNATGVEHRLVPVADLSLEEFEDSLRVDLRGTFLGLKYQIPAIIESGGGAVINMSSGAGLGAITNLGSYVTAKAGIIALTKVAALEYADHGVRVNVVAPGPIRTEHIIAAGDEAQQYAAASVPMRRIGEPSDVSDVLMWLCSPASSFVTGVVVPIDGGQTAGQKPPRMYDRGKSMD